MKELTVISGKGGTGKTSIAGAFAALAGNAVIADCDVDAADLHLILSPSIRRIEDFIGGKRARIIAEKCIGCGKCKELCRFDAIHLNGQGNDIVGRTFAVNPVSCEGCKVCVEFCPVNAIRFEDCVSGQWFISDTRFGTMVHARLGAGGGNSGKLVSLIRREAGRIAETERKELIIVDGCPGIGCPVIASITGADLVLIVTEPTLSGRHDMERAAELAAGFKIPVLAAINKFDLNLEVTEQIEQDARRRGIEVVGKIHYDKAFTKAQILKLTVPEYADGAVSEEIKTLWKNINVFIGKEKDRCE